MWAQNCFCIIFFCTRSRLMSERLWQTALADHCIYKRLKNRPWSYWRLRGAWRDCATNDIFAHCSLIFYFLDFKFFNFVCPSELHLLIRFFFKNSFRKKKNIRKTTQNALAPSIFIVLSIALKLSTPFYVDLLKRKILCYRIFYFALEVEIWTKTSKNAVLPHPVGFAEV